MLNKTCLSTGVQMIRLFAYAMYANPLSLYRLVTFFDSRGETEDITWCDVNKCKDCAEDRECHCVEGG